MKKLRAIIADDELDALEILGSLLEDTDKVEVIDRISDSLKVESAINKHNPDVLFLDIEMPQQNGIQLLTNIREYNQHLPIILVTAYGKYVEEAIKHNVFSYLVKPADREELQGLIEKLEMLHDQNGDSTFEQDKIKLPINEGYVYIQYDELFSLEAEGNYTIIHTTRGEEYLSSYNLGRLLKKLPDYRFFRVNRSTVLNGDYIYKLNKKNNTCYARVGDKVFQFEVSQVFITQFNRLNK